MSNVNQVISNFLRDAQYRIGEISRIISASDQDLNDPDNLRLAASRDDLYRFMISLYNARYSFIDSAYRFLDWTDEEILREIDYQRYWGGVNEIPYMTFVAYYPWIVNNVIGNGGVSIGVPNGGLGQYLVYTDLNVIGAQDFPKRCGVNLGENIDDYFSG